MQLKSKLLDKVCDVAGLVSSIFAGNAFVRGDMWGFYFGSWGGVGGAAGSTCFSEQEGYSEYFPTQVFRNLFVEISSAAFSSGHPDYGAVSAVIAFIYDRVSRHEKRRCLEIKA